MLIGYVCASILIDQQDGLISFVILVIIDFSKNVQLFVFDFRNVSLLWSICAFVIDIYDGHHRLYRQVSESRGNLDDIDNTSLERMAIIGIVTIHFDYFLYFEEQQQK